MQKRDYNSFIRGHAVCVHNQIQYLVFIEFSSEVQTEIVPKKLLSFSLNIVVFFPFNQWESKGQNSATN